MCPQNNSPKTTELAERVKSILASKQLTLHQISRSTEALYGKSSPFFLPHNLYYDFGLNTFTPSLHQVFALSRLSHYRMADWMRVFGFEVGDVTRLQVLLPFSRTTLLDSSLDDPHSWVVRFRSKSAQGSLPGVVPLGRLLDHASPQRITYLSNINSHTFLYAKLGRQDDFAFPDLLPGSIVRVNPHFSAEECFPTSGRISNHCFLIEHARGICCCRIQFVGKDRIIPISTQLPYAQIELRLPNEVTILGVVDAEIRPLLNPEQPEVPHDLSRHWRPEALTQPEMKLGPFLRHARVRMALSFRDASDRTRRIATLLGDPQYFASPGSLSDYEAFDTAPRHIHKAISLCAIYGVRWSAFLKSSGLLIEDAGTEFMPDQFPGRPLPTNPALQPDAPETEGTFLTDLLKQWNAAVPFFLRGSLSAWAGLRSFSLHDVFWIDPEQSPLDVDLAGGLLAIVNRRKKRPFHWKSKPIWQQPLYIVLKRDGTYQCAFCSLENGTLVLHSYAQGYHRSERMRNRQEGEVAGQVVALARKLR